MAVIVNYLKDGLGVEILGEGDVIGQEIIEAQEMIYHSEYVLNHRYHIIDRTKCDSYLVSAEEIKTISELDKEAAKVNPNIIMAIVSPTDLIDGMSGLWQAHVEDHVFLTKRFSNRQDAETWIQAALSNQLTD